MARPRIRQFAGDMGISYDEAQNLIKKSRGRKDGGSQVLESNMNKMRGYESGGTNKMELPKPKPRIKMELPKPKPDSVTRSRLGDADTKQMEYRRDRRKIQKMLEENKGEEVKAADGKFMSCRGMGAAIQGNKFTGVK